MRVRELIDILSDQDPDAEVELSIVAPTDEDDDDVEVDRYRIDGVLPWEDDDIDPDGDETPSKVWLIGGEADDVERFLDAVEGLEGGLGGTHTEHPDHDHDDDHHPAPPTDDGRPRRRWPF